MTDRPWINSGHGIGLPELEQEIRPSSGEKWIVTVYDNDFNTEDEVITVLMLATGCTTEEAYIETWEIHNLGQSVVHRSDADECKGVAEVVGVIGIRVEVTPEP